MAHSNEDAHNGEDDWPETAAGRMWMLVQDQLLDDDTKAPFAEVHESDDGSTLVFWWRCAVPEPLPEPFAIVLRDHAGIALVKHEVLPPGR